MRASGLSVVSLAVALSMYGCAAAVHQEPRQDLSEHVVLSASCRSDTVTFSAIPWKARTEKGRSVRWSVDANSDVKVFRLGDVNGWPFHPGPPMTPGAGQPVSSPAVRNDAKRDNRYTVIFNCQGRDVIIDPEIIVWNGS